MPTSSKPHAKSAPPLWDEQAWGATGKWWNGLVDSLAALPLREIIGMIGILPEWTVKEALRRKAIGRLGENSS